MSVENDQKFKQLFWDWFDSIPIQEKEKYWYFKLDLASTYFYNKIYAKILEDDNEQIYGPAVRKELHR